MKISFDFDKTLSEPIIQEIAARFIKAGDDVWITTSRYSDTSRMGYNNDKVFETASKLGIPKEKIVFTNAEDKYLFLKDFSIHFDDDNGEIMMINKRTTCSGLLVGYKDLM